MIGIVDVGGGLRGVYGAGVFDTCLEEKITFDYLIGVSAGSANVASFLAGQRGRNLRFYTDYAFRKAYMSLGNFLRRGNYLDLDYIYGGTLSNTGGEDPLDYDAMAANPAQAKVVATDAATGQPVYFDFHDMARDDYGAIKASSCVPVANRPYWWKGRPYYDGGITDPIPFQKALDAGCDRVVVILTRDKSYVKKPMNPKPIDLWYKHYPALAEQLKNRHNVYNNALRELLNWEQQGKAWVLHPSQPIEIGRLERRSDKLQAVYDLGTGDAEASLGSLRTYLAQG